MPKLTLKRLVINEDDSLQLESEEDDSVQLQPEDEYDPSLKNQVIPIDTFLACGKKPEHCAVWLSSADDVYALKDELDKIDVIVCHFNSFTDGRSFSQARILREHLEYKGIVRAAGNFIQDQMHYLSRCGFDEFSVPDDLDEASLCESISDFSESYQAAADVPAPLFRRRD